MSPDLRSARYINLATYRRDGRAVETPVWAVSIGELLYCYTEGNAGKVKRVRATGRVRVAPGDARGRVLGDWHEGRGRVVEEPDLRRRVYEALAIKYGWVYRVLTLFAMLSGGYARRSVLELQV